MAPKPKLNVHSFPRPPLLEKTPRHLQIKWNGHTIADTKDAYWVLETTHPPTYYLPRTSLSIPLHPSASKHSSYCEWKGKATYYDLIPPPPSSNPHSASNPSASASTSTVHNKAWTYLTPTPSFAALAGYISFYANAPWECFVDGERVQPQEGDFYGGWVTSELEGRMKGGAGTWGW